MKNATQCAKKLKALLSKEKPPAQPVWPEGAGVLEVLVHSFLLWECTAEKAQAAWEKIQDAVVDYNELRVTMPQEVGALIGARYPRAAERCERLRATLRDIYLREHAIELDQLRGQGKREIKKYLDSLDGAPPFVSSRVQLLCFDIHSIPVDEQLRRALIEAGAADEEADVNALSTWLSRQIKAADAAAAHAALQRWAEGQSRRGERRTSARKPTAKKKAATKKTPRSSTQRGTRAGAGSK